MKYRYLVMPIALALFSGKEVVSSENFDEPIGIVGSVKAGVPFDADASFTNKTLAIILGEGQENEALRDRISMMLNKISEAYKSLYAEQDLYVDNHSEKDRLDVIAQRLKVDGSKESNALVDFVMKVIQKECDLSKDHSVFIHGIAHEVSFALDMITLLEGEGTLDNAGQIVTERYLLRDPNAEKSFMNEDVTQVLEKFYDLYAQKNNGSNAEDTLENIRNRVPFDRDTKTVLLHMIKETVNNSAYADSFICLNIGLFGGATSLGQRSSEGSFALARFLDIPSDFTKGHYPGIVNKIFIDYFAKRLTPETAQNATATFMKIGEDIAKEVIGKSAGTIVQVAFPKNSSNPFYAAEASGGPLAVVEGGFSAEALTTFMDKTPAEIEAQLSGEGNTIFHTSNEWFNPEFGNVSKVQARWLWENTGEDVKVLRHRMFSYSPEQANAIKELVSLYGRK